MAFILFVAGGVAGVMAMLTSIVVFDVSFLAALAIWFATGMIFSLICIVLAMAPRPTVARGRLVEA